MCAMDIVTGILVLVAGASIGSFLNVCIYRLPREESIVKPRSACPHCHRTLSVAELVPVFSFIAQGGKCRSCGKKLRWQYPAVEVLTAICFYFTVSWFGTTGEALIFLVFISSLIVVFFIDLEHRVILNCITFPGIVFGLAVSLYPHFPFYTEDILERIISSVLGIFAGSGVLYLLAVAGEKIFRKEAMGGGDIKLIAYIGAVMGWKYSFITLYISCILGAVIGVLLMAGRKVERRGYIPFGPFMVIATLLMIFYGNGLMRFILSFYRPVN